MSFENIPNVDSAEFEKILEENGWTKKEDTAQSDCCCDGACSFESKDEKTSWKEKFTLKNAVNAVDAWSMEHPGLSLVIFLGGSSFLMYKFGQSFIAGAVHKGNLKTIRYIDRLGR